MGGAENGGGEEAGITAGLSDPGSVSLGICQPSCRRASLRITGATRNETRLLRGRLAGGLTAGGLRRTGGQGEALRRRLSAAFEALPRNAFSGLINLNMSSPSSHVTV
ncbi:hypothetical protein SKAU_G00401440 [Synaphobranchus kaupii]|uniref:Uncharacterized protein n=1 Tax=Synaphobranchus kaupii TaxID=118154 RepID=A0A9Q1E965_SYNKA|nr:hypothetical protein SKAU_G00401440 [Synaphobranchus kaupii]